MNGILSNSVADSGPENETYFFKPLQAEVTAYLLTNAWN